jgi:RNA polymerase sigma-70 factor (ECF subfamily)
VYRAAWQVVRNVEDARDVAQTVFIRLWRVLKHYRQEQKFDTWLYRITVNLAIDHQRRRRAGGAGVPVPLESVPDPLAPGGGADRLDRMELRRVYDAAAAELTERQRLIFTLREVEGMPAEEIARSLGVTASTVRNTHFQARALLRDAVRRLFPDYVPPGDRSGEGSGS